MVLQSKIEIIGQHLGLDLNFLIKNGFWSITRQLITSTVGIVLSVAMARILTQEIFGQYQLFLTILSILSILSLPGLNTSVLQSVANGYDGVYKKSVRLSFLWGLLGVPTLLVTGGYYIIFGDISIGICLMVASIFFPFLYAFNSWDAFLQAKERFDLTMKFASFQSVSACFAIIVVILINPDQLLPIILTYLILNSAFNYYWFKRSLVSIKNNRTEEGSLSYGKFLTKINVLSTITTHLDSLLVGLLLGPIPLAIYSINYQILRSIIEFIKSILSIYSPRIARYNTLRTKYYVIIFFIFSGFSGIVFFLVPILVRALYSEKYSEVITLIRVTIVFLPVMVINYFYRNHIILYLKEKSIIIKESIILPVLKIVVMVILLKFFSLIGLAVYSGFQYILGIIVLYFLINAIKKSKLS